MLGGFGGAYALCPQAQIGAKGRKGRRRSGEKEQRQNWAEATKVYGEREMEQHKSQSISTYHGVEHELVTDKLDLQCF